MRNEPGDHDTPDPLDRPGHSRTSAAWTLSAAALFLALLMLVFVFQNGEKVNLEFLWIDLRVPLGAALLLAAVIGGLLVLSLGAARLLQLRLAARRHRRLDAARA